MPFQSEQTQIIMFFEWRSYLTFDFEVSPGAKLPLPHINGATPNPSSQFDIRNVACVRVSVGGGQNVEDDPMSRCLGKSHWINMIEHCYMPAAHFHDQFTTCLATILFQNCFKTIFVEFEVKIAIFEFCDLFRVNVLTDSLRLPYSHQGTHLMQHLTTLCTHQLWWPGHGLMLVEFSKFCIDFIKYFQTMLPKLTKSFLEPSVGRLTYIDDAFILLCS